MDRLISLHNSVFARLERQDWILPTVARLIFAGVLLMYFWASGLTKLGDGVLGFIVPSTGAYAQIFPKALEAVSYDTSQLSLFHWAVVWAGTMAEFLLPAALVLGFATRLAALGMIGFVVVQSLTDVYGHGADAGTIGTWFDRASDAHILDQRAFWVFLLLVLVIKGAGPLSLDRLLARRQQMAPA
ncbi:DoxX family protein [Cognatishimia sp. SS12]|uniref:DoxX family protein n=1 Tax=Cognatishimia sp. SS12 TaxID=2979465 RepID=UPI0023315747|nr:DoxX family protein [Cognatishimia sp. SS12]MDC0736771.1 DoxX family protein [Cognatishimia sp. SS12]